MEQFISDYHDDKLFSKIFLNIPYDQAKAWLLSQGTAKAYATIAYLNLYNNNNNIEGKKYLDKAFELDPNCPEAINVWLENNTFINSNTIKKNAELYIKRYLARGNFKRSLRSFDYHYLSVAYKCINDHEKSLYYEIKDQLLIPDRFITLFGPSIDLETAKKVYSLPEFSQQFSVIQQLIAENEKLRKDIIELELRPGGKTYEAAKADFESHI